MDTDQPDADRRPIASPRSDEIDLLDYLKVVLRRRRVILGMILVFVAAASVGRFRLVPPPYVAEINVRVLGADLNSPAFQTFEEDLKQVVLGLNIPAKDAQEDSVTIQTYLGKTVRQSLESLSHIAEITRATGGLVSVVVHEPDSAAAVSILDAFHSGIRTVANSPASKVKHINRQLEETDRLIREQERLQAVVRDSLLHLSSRSLRSAEDSVRSIQSELLRWSDQELRSVEDSLVSFRQVIRAQQDTKRFLELEKELERRERRITQFLELREDLQSGDYGAARAWNDDTYNELIRERNRRYRKLEQARKIDNSLLTGAGGDGSSGLPTDYARKIQSLVQSYGNLAEQRNKLLASTPEGRVVEVQRLSQEVRAGVKDFRYNLSNWLAGGVLAGLGVGVLVAFIVEFFVKARQEGRLNDLRDEGR